MRNKITLVLILLLIAAGAGYAIWQKPAQKVSLQASTEQVASISTVTVGSKKFIVEVATSPEDQSRGLSGRTELAKGTGMLFIFEPAQIQSFWMKDMIIPLDIVWVANDKIIGFERNVPPPTPGTPPEKLTIYSPPAAIDYVLELNVGDSKELKVGDSFSLETAKGV